MIQVTIKELLEAGVHFGHQTKRWNPKMSRYIFEERSGIYIIDLQKTLKQLLEVCEFIATLVAQEKKVLFIGTKKQAKDVIAAAAQHCNMPYVNERWLGGMLTNMKTIRNSIQRLRELEEMESNGTMALLSKKEASSLRREKAKLQKNLSGIINMDTLPGAIYVIDSKRERIPVAEANKLHIPVISIVDTNCDPDEITYCIPGNDDAIRAIKLITSVITDAVMRGLEKIPKELKPEESEEAEEKLAEMEGLLEEDLLKKTEKEKSLKERKTKKKEEEVKAGAAAVKTAKKKAKPRKSEKRG